MGPEQLPHDPHVLRIVDLHQDDRDVPGDPVRPEGGGPSRMAREHVRGRSKRSLRVKNAAGEALEEVGLVGPDADMVQLHLGLRPRQGARTVERRRIVILLGESQDFLPRRGNHRREGDPDGDARAKSYPEAEAHDRIEHGAHGVGERLVVGHRQGCPDPASAAQEPRAISFPLEGADPLVFGGHGVGKPHL